MLERHAGAPWEHHVMIEHHGGKCSILTLKKLFHMGRHASAMGEKCFHSNLEQKLPNRGAMEAPCH